MKELNGALLVIDVLGYEQGITTVHGEKDAVRCNVGVVDGPKAGTQENDVLLFGGFLIGSLKGSIGKKTCGRLSQGPGKPGQEPPWILLDPTDTDVAAGIAFTNQQQAPSAQAPVQQAPGGYQQPAQAPGGYQPPPAPQGGYQQPAGQQPAPQQFPPQEAYQPQPQGYPAQGGYEAPRV